MTEPNDRGHDGDPTGGPPRPEDATVQFIAPVEPAEQQAAPATGDISDMPAELPPAADSDSDEDDAQETAEAVTYVPNTTDVVSVGDGQNISVLARLLLDIAAALGHHAHSVDYLPTQGGFVVPLEVAQAYAAHVAEPVDGGPVAAPKGSRQVRTAILKKQPAKKAPRRAKKDQEGGGTDG